MFVHKSGRRRRAREKVNCFLPETRERVKSRAVELLPDSARFPHKKQACLTRVLDVVFQLHNRSSFPLTTPQPRVRRPGSIYSLYGWERDAGRGLPPRPCYCSVNTHSAPPPTFFTDATRRLSPPARANQALFVQLHGNSGTFTETLAL